MSGVPHAQRKSQDHKIAEQQHNEVLDEEELKQQEEEDDHDIRALKDKLKKLADQKPPENKDDLIHHLMQRLQQAETAIGACEEVITHERQTRKAISKELKSKNQELRDIVNAEKKKLQDKVHDELEKTLNQALKEKLKAEAKYVEAVQVMRERDFLVEELDGLFISLRDEHKATEKLNIDQQKIIEHLEEELQQTKDDRDRLQHISDERQINIQKLNTELDEAYGVITKLEEARIVLNRLLGPQGVITERERQKFLKGVHQEGTYPQGGENKKGGALQRRDSGAQGVGSTSNKMLNANNQYFYEGGKPPKKASPNKIVQNTSLMDDANEDDFWYQAPKMAGDSLAGEYQGYVNNPNLSSGGGPRQKGKY